MSRNIIVYLSFILLTLAWTGCSRQKAECLAFDPDTCLVRTCIHDEQPNQDLVKAGYKTGDSLYRIDAVEREQNGGDCVVKSTKTTCYDSLEQFEKNASELKCEKKDPKLCVVESPCETVVHHKPTWPVYTIWDKQVKSFSSEAEREEYLKSDEIALVELDEEDPIRKELSLPEDTIFITKNIHQELLAKIKENFASTPAACIEGFDYHINVMTAMTYDAQADKEIECPWLDEDKLNGLFVIKLQDISVRIFLNKYDFEYAVRFLECKNMKNDHLCVVD